MTPEEKLAELEELLLSMMAYLLEIGDEAANEYDRFYWKIERAKDHCKEALAMVNPIYNCHR